MDGRKGRREKEKNNYITEFIHLFFLLQSQALHLNSPYKGSECTALGYIYF